MAGLFLGSAWIFPGEKIAGLFCFLSAVSFCYSFLNPKVNLKLIYLGGIFSHVLAFSWLVHTIEKFGGFNYFFSILIFSIFLAISGLQFLLVGWIVRILDKEFKNFALSCTLCWCAVEFFIFRLFPWYFGHALLGLPSLVQIADIGGSILVSFLLFWIAEVLVRILFFNEKNYRFWLAFGFLIFAIAYGKFRVEQFSFINLLKDNTNKFEFQNLAVVQANVSIEEKHNQALILANTERYLELSKNLPGPDTLIIWPESAINDFIYNKVASVGNDAKLPFFDSNNPLLIGALSFDDHEQIYNSAFAILNNGTVLDPYHKQVLMPFGEFMPLSKTFPFIKKLNPIVADFTAGISEKVFEYPMVRENGDFYTARISPLICYEDVIAEPSRNSVLMGAQLLVNITNDAWFGKSLAPYQHNLIASFRAIENRRVLIRSTNTGLTSVIAPNGITIDQLEIFSEGVLTQKVPLITDMTLYTAFVGNWLGWILVVVVATLVVSNYQARKN